MVPLTASLHQFLPVLADTIIDVGPNIKFIILVLVGSVSTAVPTAYARQAKLAAETASRQMRTNGGSSSFDQLSYKLDSIGSKVDNIGQRVTKLEGGKS